MGGSGVSSSGGLAGVPKQALAGVVAVFLLLFWAFSSFTLGGDSGAATRSEAIYVYSSALTQPWLHLASLTQP